MLKNPKSSRSAVFFLPTSLVCLGVALEVLEINFLALFWLTGAFVLLYRHVRDWSTLALWAVHPFRFLLPLFVLGQIVPLAWFLVGAEQGRIYMYTSESLTRGCFDYLLVYYPYFAGISLAIQRELPNEGNTRRSLRSALATTFAITVTLTANILFLVTYLVYNTPLTISYVSSIIGRLSPLGLGVIVYIMLQRNSWALRVLYGGTLILNIILTIIIGLYKHMRFAFVEEVLIITLIYLCYGSRAKSRYVILGVGMVAAVLVLGFITSRKIADIAISTDAGSGDVAISEVRDSVLTRSCQYTVEAMVEEDIQVARFFENTRSELLSEIAAGLPFGGLIMGMAGRTGGGLNMQFHHWLTNTFGESSIFFSVFTQVRYGYGTAHAMITGLLVGILHGLVLRLTIKSLKEISFVAVGVGMYSVALHGLTATGVLKVAFYLVLYIYILNFLFPVIYPKKDMVS